MDRSELLRFIKSNARVSVREVCLIIGEACGCSGVSLYQGCATPGMREKFQESKLLDKHGKVSLSKVPEMLRLMLMEDMLGETDGGAIYRKFKKIRKIGG
jgi:hypothetical protein